MFVVYALVVLLVARANANFRLIYPPNRGLSQRVGRGVAVMMIFFHMA